VRLLCDEMLARLARWLRVAGHDTLLASRGATDGALLALGRDDDRLLLSRDRRLVAAAGHARALLVSDGDLDAQARMLRTTIELDWGFAPFTRCMVDNAPLEPAGAADLGRVPAGSRDLPGQVRVCPTCRRIYWPGSHFARMAQRLERWRTGA